MRLRHSVAAGLADSALASLATFLIGLFATKQLSLSALGIYGLAFSAFVFAASVPALLVFTPAEIALLRTSPAKQLGSLPHSLRLAFWPAIGAAVLAGGVVLLVERGTSGVVPILVGGFVASIVSPMQDHVRRMLHQVNRNIAAAEVSLAQVSVAGLVILGLSHAGIDKAWIPFAALAAANIVSGGLGLVLAARGWERPDPPLFHALHLTRVGGWLLMSGSLDLAGGFVALTILSAVAGSDTVGRYEATRVLSQPLYVLASGLLAVVNPRAMRAAQGRERHEARRYTLVYLGSFGLCGLAYLLVAGIQWPHNPLVKYFPNAYVTRGLIAAMIVMQIVVYGNNIMKSQVVAIGRQQVLARVGVLTTAANIGLVALLAGVVGAFSIPLASVTVTTAVVLVCVSQLRRWYAAPSG